MNDAKTTIDNLKLKIKQFMDEREWRQFHSPKNVSMSIVREASELMEHFLWCDNNESFDEVEKKRIAVEDEIADVAVGLLNFCTIANIDLNQAIERKLEKNRAKYPIDKSKGRSEKYLHYQEIKNKNRSS